MKGLVLAGGKSSRLGINKAFVAVHNEPQVNYLLKQFEILNILAFVGVTSASKSDFQDFPIIEDEPGLKGPLASIVAALKREEGPWIILAVDMPFIDHSVIQTLIQNRNPDHIATSFTVDGTTPEPMITLWEESSLQLLIEYVNSGGTSPIEFLKENNAYLVKVNDPDWVFNINTKEDLKKVQEQLGSGS